MSKTSTNFSTFRILIPLSTTRSMFEGTSAIIVPVLDTKGVKSLVISCAVMNFKGTICITTC